MSSRDPLHQHTRNDGATTTNEHERSLGKQHVRWWPLFALLAATALFDLIAIFGIKSLNTHVFISIMSVCYVQTLLSAIWLACGFGRLGGRLLIASVLLAAAVATLSCYIANAIGVSFFRSSADMIAASLVPIAAIFVFGCVAHWFMCLLLLGVMRVNGWRLNRPDECPSPRSSSARLASRGRRHGRGTRTGA